MKQKKNAEAKTEGFSCWWTQTITDFLASIRSIESDHVIRTIQLKAH